MRVHLLIATLGAALAAPCIVGGPAGAADAWTPTDGWFTLHHDAMRTGRTQDSPGVPFEYVWHKEYWDELIAPEAEPIVAEGLVFFGTFKGVLHALDASTGKEAWQADLHSPVRHSPAYEGGKLVVATMSPHGEVVAFEAGHGKELWRFRPRRRGGFAASPTIYRGAVYIGDRAGDFYAIDLAGGTQRWRIELGAPVLQTASVKDGKVAVAAEDLVPRLLAAEDGKELWKGKQMAGATVRGYYPVFWKDLVIWRTETYGIDVYQNNIQEGTEDGRLYAETRRKHGWSKQAEDIIKTIPGRYADEKYQQEQQYIQKQMESGKHVRSFYALKVADGSEPVIYAVGYHANENGYASAAGSPVDQDGTLYVFTKSVYSEWPYPIRAFDAVSTLDYDTGLPRLIRGIDRTNGSFPATCDESNNLTIAGDKLYDTHDHVLAYMDIKTRKIHNAYSSHSPELWGGVFKASAADNAQAGSPGQWKLRDPFNSLHLTIQWNGPTQGAVAIVKDKVWWITGSMIVCLKSGTVATAPPELRVDLSSLVGWSHLPVGPTFSYDPARTLTYLGQAIGGAPASAPAATAELRKELAAAVDEILDCPWLPLYSDYSAAQAGGVGPAEWCFNRPGEYMLALAQAAPYMTDGQKAKARTFLRGMIASCSPTRQVYLPIKEGGKPRTIRQAPAPKNPWHAEPEAQRLLFGEAYAVWAFASAFDAWDDARPMLDDLKKLRAQLEGRDDFTPAYKAEHAGPLTDADAQTSAYRFNVYQALLAGFQDNYWYHGAREARERMQKDKPVFFYVRTLTALVGYHRLAQHAALADEAKWAQQTFDKVAALAVGQRSAPFLWSDPALCPEVARLLRDAAGPWLDELAKTPNVGDLPATDWGNKPVPGRRDYYVMNPYTWFHAWGGQGEGIRPRTVMGAFLANAWLLSAPPDKAAETLDIPWCKADLYYVGKLAALIQAGEKAGWTAVK